MTMSFKYGVLKASFLIKINRTEVYIHLEDTTPNSD